MNHKISTDLWWTTFDGRRVLKCKMSQQHLSNVYWFMVVVQKFPVHEFQWVGEELRNSFNGQLLPYRPHVDFKEERKLLEDQGMLLPTFEEFRKLIILPITPDSLMPIEIGEIIEFPSKS